MDVWEMVRDERQRIADRLSDLSEDDWEGPTLCEKWRVRDVVGHLLTLASMKPKDFFTGMARSRLSFDTWQREAIRAQTEGKSPAELLAAFTAIISAHGKPPGSKKTALGEVLVHSEDIFRPVGGAFGEHPPEHLVMVADLYKHSTWPVPVRKRIHGVTLRMIDADWSYGSGPEVAGPGISVVMAMVGRKVALTDLKGEGVAVLSART